MRYMEFQSTLPMRGVTGFIRECAKIDAISIHTPHAGSDGCYEISIKQMANISIHTPHAGSDDLIIFSEVMFDKFQSTLPMRGVNYFVHG
mgnify:CR=1 FL=1